MIYQIVNITHSGRKGIRGEKCDDIKYDALIGALINNFSINDIQQFRPIKWYLVDNSMYDWWTTSEVIQVSLSYNNTFVIETINTIYELEAI